MSVELVRIPASASCPEIRVILALTAAQRAAVFALRYTVYVQELGLLDDTHPFVEDEQLRDPWDERSILLLALVDGAPAGTLRLTGAAEGPLEIEQYRSLDAFTRERGALCEATRYMVLRRWRGSLVGWALMLGLWRAMARSGLRELAVAGKVGALGRYYRTIGLHRVGEQTFTYDLVGPHRYHLMRLDVGLPWSLRRLRWVAFVKALDVALVLLGQRGRVFGGQPGATLGEGHAPPRVSGGASQGRTPGARARSWGPGVC